MYTYNKHPMVETYMACVMLSLLSIVGVIIVFILGKGWRYFIVILFFTQIICMFFFYIPQILGPFFMYEDKNDQQYCQIDQNENNQQCIPDRLCQLQSYFTNSSFLASSMISLYSCYVIKKTLNLNKLVENKNEVYWMHLVIGVITFALCIPMLFYVEYEHYGMSWQGERVYYICNMALDEKDSEKYPLTRIWFYLSIIVNATLLIASYILGYLVQRQKKKINDHLTLEINQYSSLNLYVLPATLISFWSINIGMKIFDSQTDNILHVDNVILNILWMIPQLLITLQGFNYASIFFYAFHLQLVPNLPKNLRPIYLFFARISIYNCIFGKIKISNQEKQSLLIGADNAKESTQSSYIQKDESSLNR